MQVAGAVHPLDPVELDVAGRGRPTDPGEWPARIEPGHGLRYRRDHLLGTQHADVQVGQERDDPPPLVGRGVEHDRPGLHDRHRRPGHHAIGRRDAPGVQAIVDNVTLAISIVGAIALVSGVLILAGAVAMTKFQRVYEAAILRTLGASPGSIMGIFVVQGAAVGVIGTLAGLLLGLLVAFNIDVIVPFLEHLFHASFLPRDIYLISRMPSDPQQSDIVPIALISLVLAFVATIYPSWRASRVNPAEALRYE